MVLRLVLLASHPKFEVLRPALLDWPQIQRAAEGADVQLQGRLEFWSFCLLQTIARATWGEIVTMFI